MPAAYFDMDGTLLKGDSNNFLTAYLLKQKVIDQKFLEPLQDFHERYARGELQIEDFVYYIIKPFIGMPKDERDSLIQGTLTEGGLLDAIRKGGIDEIKRRKMSGAEVMIVSSTIDCLIEPIAAALDVKYTAAAPLEYDKEGRVTGRIAGLVPYQGQKVQRIKELLEKLNLTNEGSCAYGDSINDFEMLTFAERGFLIHPSRALLEKRESLAMQELYWDYAECVFPRF